jgi:hypothetical protein
MAGVHAAIGAGAQALATPAASGTELELTAEVATTSEEGYPEALRVTLKNVGGVGLMLPLLGDHCSPENGVKVRSSWSAPDGTPGISGGTMCGIYDGPGIFDRAKTDWILLRPGESMTTMLRVMLVNKEAGTEEYWVTYTPPNVTEQDRRKLFDAGMMIPTEELETEHRSFEVR